MRVHAPPGGQLKTRQLWTVQISQMLEDGVAVAEALAAQNGTNQSFNGTLASLDTLEYLQRQASAVCYRLLTQ